VLLDQSGLQHEVLGALRGALEFAAPLLTADARLWLVVDYDALDGPSRAGMSPPGELRQLARQCGFDCDAIRPVDADGRHVLVARCRRSEAGAALARSA
jgi:hypothetical protein